MAISFETPTIQPPTAEEANGDLQLSTAQPEGTTIGSNTGQTPSLATGSTNLTTQHQDFLSQWLQNPTRYGQEIVQQGIDLANQESQRGFDLGTARLDEMMSMRGLVGSDIEATATADLISQLNQQREQRLFDLNREMANTYAQDMASAATAATQFGQLGLGMGELGLGYEQLFQQGGQFGQELAQRESEFARQFGLSSADLDLRSQQLMQQYELEGRSLDLQEARDLAEIDLRADQLFEQRRQFDQNYTLDQARLDAQREQFATQIAQQESEFSRQYGLQTESLAVEVQRLMQEAELEGRSLDIQEATQQAELELRSQQILEQARQFDQSFTLDEARLQAQRDQFQMEIDQQASQFQQQYGLQSDQLALEAQRLMQEADLENRSLDLQAATSEAELNLRTNQLMEEARQFDQTLTFDQARLMAEEQQFQSSLSFQYSQLSEQTRLSEAELQFQREQMLEDSLNQSLDRAQQWDMQQSSQLFQATEADYNRALEREALQLQLQGMTMEEAWRTADRDLTRELESRALSLQESGLAADQAYRAATLQLEAELADRDREAEIYQSELAAYTQQQNAMLSALTGIADSLNTIIAASGGTIADATASNLDMSGLMNFFNAFSQPAPTNPFGTTGSGKTYGETSTYIPTQPLDGTTSTGSTGLSFDQLLAMLAAYGG
jgi:hypothetical protein